MPVIKLLVIRHFRSEYESSYLAENIVSVHLQLHWLNIKFYLIYEYQDKNGCFIIVSHI